MYMYMFPLVLVKAIHSRKIFGFSITPDTLISYCCELNKNTFITCNLHNMNGKGVLNIINDKMTCPILKWRYLQLTDLTSSCQFIL